MRTVLEGRRDEIGTIRATNESREEGFGNDDERENGEMGRLQWTVGDSSGLSPVKPAPESGVGE